MSCCLKDQVMKHQKLTLQDLDITPLPLWQNYRDVIIPISILNLGESFTSPNRQTQFDFEVADSI